MPFRKFPFTRPAKSFVPPPSIPSNAAVAHIDGGSRGNPGPAAYGVLLKAPNGKVAGTLSRFLGRQTNNFAEYSGLIAALEYSLQLGFHSLQVFSDSELLVRQVQGIYQVRNENIRPLYERARELIRQFEWFGVEHVRRERNREADGLANRAMDQAGQNQHAGSSKAAAADKKK
jgi:ribonuclease HI